MYIHTSVHKHIYTYTHKCYIKRLRKDHGTHLIHKYTNAYIHTYVHTYINRFCKTQNKSAYMSIFTIMYLHMYIYTRTCVHAPTLTHICMYTHIYKDIGT